MPWAIENLHIVWFKHDLKDIDARSVFNAAIGREPDGYQSNRIVTAQAPFLSVATASRDGVLQRVQVGPGRIDLITSADINQEQPLASVPGAPVELIESQAAMFDRAVSLVGSCVRIALVVNLVEQTPTVEAASEKVAAYFATKSWRDALDASFQLNRRIEFDTAPELMNRLLRMNNVSVQGFAFQAQAGGVPTNIPTSIIAHGVQYMLDLNLAPTGAEFEPAVLISMFKELTIEAKRIFGSSSLEEALG